MLCVLRVLGRTDTPEMCTDDEFRSCISRFVPRVTGPARTSEIKSLSQFGEVEDSHPFREFMKHCPTL